MTTLVIRPPRKHIGLPDTPPPSREPRTGTVTSTPDGTAIPIVYGTAKVPGIAFVMVQPAATGDLVIAYAYCSGPCQAMTSLIIGGIDCTSIIGGGTADGITVEAVHLGTSAQTVSAKLAAVITGYVERHPGLCYNVVTITPSAKIYGGLPEAQAVIQGRNDVWDPRLGGGAGGYAISTNPALIICHLATSPDGGAAPTAILDWVSSITGLANIYDLVLNGAKIFELNGVINTRATLRQNLDTLMSQVFCYDVWDNNLWELHPYVSQGEGGTYTPVATITMDWVATEGDGGPARTREEIQHSDQVPTVVHVRFPDASRDYEESRQEAMVSGVTAGTVPRRESDLSTPHLTSATLAKRHAVNMIRMATADGRAAIVCNRRALILERGDCVATSAVEGVQNGTWLVDDVVLHIDGTVDVHLAETWFFSDNVQTSDTATRAADRQTGGHPAGGAGHRLGARQARPHRGPDDGRRPHLLRDQGDLRPFS